MAQIRSSVQLVPIYGMRFLLLVGLLFTQGVSLLSSLFLNLFSSHWTLRSCSAYHWFTLLEELYTSIMQCDTIHWGTRHLGNGV